MRRCFLSGVVLLFQAIATSGLVAREFEVSVQGSDADDGSAAHPLRTISAAARLAQPGDTITVHAGIYRERIDPPRGGTSDSRRIVYQAAPGEKVEIAGSEEVKSWVKVQGDVWKATLPNSFFGAFNPYSVKIHGDWFSVKSKQHHPGAVYVNGMWINEAPSLDAVLKATAKEPLWFAQVDKDNTTIWSDFPGVDPNGQEVEVNVRETVFYPSKTGINYLTVQGFTLRDAATPWAPPTAEQVGLIGTDWSKGWIIEDNTVFHSTCAGISLGKYGDSYDNTSANTAQGYVLTIQRALKNGWDGATVGHHVVRHNTIYECGQAGVVGSLGGIFSEVSGNTIYNISINGEVTGAETAGIKLHGAVDTLISGNRIHDCSRGIWLDWMAQGTHVTRNLFYRNRTIDLFVEVDHGPFLVDDNLFLTVPVSLQDVSEGGAYVHNLFGGGISSWVDLGRATPYLKAHSTALGAVTGFTGGDDRFYDNVFTNGATNRGARASTVITILGRNCGGGLSVYASRKIPLQTGGNVYYAGAKPYPAEKDAVVTPDDPNIKLTEDGDHVELQANFGETIGQAKTQPVTTALLGQTHVSKLPYENPDGSPLTVDTDYFGKQWSATSPAAGPFANPGTGPQTIKVW